MAHLHQIMEHEETRAAAQTTRVTHEAAHRRGMDAPSWLLAGQDGIVEYLTHRPRQAAEVYMSTHAVDLPIYMELASPPVPIAAASLSGNLLAEPVSMDAEMSANANPAPVRGHSGSPYTASALPTPLPVDFSPAAHFRGLLD